MKKIQQTNTDIINDMDDELKDLAEAFVEAAIQKGCNATSIYKLTQETWRVCNGINSKEEAELLEETLDEQEFRKKSIKLIKSETMLKHLDNEFQYQQKGETKNTSIALEMLCIMYREVKSKIDLSTNHKVLENLTRKRIKAVTNSSYSPYYEVQRTYYRIKEFSDCIVEEYFCKGFGDFSKNYIYRKGSASEVILAIVWYVNKVLVL